MSGTKPFVQVACVCEKVLIEADNVPSLIRIVDTYFLHVPADTALPENVGVDLTAFIALRSGDAVGTFDLELRLTDPEENERPLQKWPIVLNGGDQGANIRLNFVLATPKIGLYWLDVLWDDGGVLTRVPFRLTYGPQRPATTEST